MTAQRLLHLVLLPIKKNLDLFSFIYLSNVILQIISRYAYQACTDKCVILSIIAIIDAYAFCIIATLCGKYVKSVIYAVIGFILFAEYFLVINFHTLINPDILALAIQTNTNESSEFFNMCLVSSTTWCSVLLFTSISLLTIVAIPRLTSLLVAYCHALTIYAKQHATISVCLFFLIIGTSCYTRILELQPIATIAYGKLTQKNVMPRYRQAFSSSIQRLLLSSFILSKQHDDTNSLAQSTSLASVDSCSFTSPTIILIIGESFNKYQTKLYNNQSLLTTPHLCERATKGNIIPYNDVVSPYNQTNKVLRQLFSMSNCDCSDNWCDYPLFLALFKKAGYEVTFVSNQYPKETYKSMWSKFDSSVFNNERLDSLQFSLRNLTDFGNDINITQVFQTLPRNANKCSIIVFHLLGQHSDYSRRHPEDYTPIAKEDIKLEYNDSEQARDIAWHYANATHYNDFVVDSIFKLFDDTETVGIYLSDHGEEVYDFRDFYHRSHEDPSYYNIAKYEYEVPFMFYATDKYQAAHPEIMQQIREAKDRPFMTDDLPQVMLYLAGIKQKDYDETRNVLSPNFNTKRKRLLNDKYDFDAIRAASKEQ